MSVRGAILWMTTSGLVWTLFICEGKNGFPTDSPLDLNTLPEDGYYNCGNAGKISDVVISNCNQLPCVFYIEDEVTLEYAFIATEDVQRLNWDLNFIDTKTGEVYNIRHSKSTSRVDAGVKYESFTRFLVNSSFPEGKGLLMEILRSFEQSQICARLPVVIISGTSTTAETTEASENTPTTTTDISDLPTTTIQPPEFSTACPKFNCEDEGIFPDPCDCSVYHTCQHYINGTFWDIELRCPEPLVWCEDIVNCAYSSTCPC
ncbi:unnamed protein product [Allacma fusca]|uniref:Chitin-binding type-2 domain-containing protein n=1 Tax=Allacma fusca TaxID=39272 RepID=A0A8J2JMI4_9HEXA|nr:unnamed protein product [Allacma fusca]